MIAAATPSALGTPDPPCEPTNRAPGFCGDGGRATAAQLAAPFGLARLPDGGFLVADSGNNRIRRISPGGKITTVAGTGSAGFSGDGGPAVDAQLSFPTNVSAVPAGGFLIADSANNRIRRVSPRGRITTVAGSGSPGFSGDGGQATDAELLSPTNVAATSDGGLLVADNGNQRVRRVFANGLIVTVAGTGRAGFSGDGGPAILAELNRPTGVAPLRGGGFLVADSKNNRIRRVGLDGEIRTVAGTGDSGASGDGEPATVAELAEPTDVSQLGRGFLIVDTGNQAVRRVFASGTIETVAGTGIAGFSGDGGPAVEARLTAPTAIAVAGRTFFIADNGNRRIRSVSAGGTIATVAGSGQTSGEGARRLAGQVAYPSGKPTGYFDPNGKRTKRGRRVVFTYVVTRDSFVRLRVVRRSNTVRRKRDRGETGLNAAGIRRLRRSGRYRVKLFVAGRRRPSDSQVLVIRR